MANIVMNDQSCNINTRKLKYLGAGKHGRVYVCGNRALKVFRKRLSVKQPNLFKKMCERAEMQMKFKVKGWKFPDSLAFKKDDIGGYFSVLVENSRSICELQNIPIEDLIEQVIISKDGSDKIAEEYHTAIRDARPRNFLWNGEFNNIDCDQYCYYPNVETRELKLHNRREMFFLIRSILFPSDYYEDPKALADFFSIKYDIFVKRYRSDKSIFISDYIEELATKTKAKTFGEIIRPWDR